MKATPPHKHSSPNRPQTTFKHYSAAIFGALDLVIYGALILALTGYAMEALS